MNWKSLTYKQKSDLMRIYLQNGISSLDAMQKHYNSFQSGGLVKDTKDNPSNSVLGFKKVPLLSKPQKTTKDQPSYDNGFLKNVWIAKNSKDYDTRARASTIAMRQAQMKRNREKEYRQGIDKELYRDLMEVAASPMQANFLLKGEDKDRFMLESGYLKGASGDYGLVKKAVGNKNLPVYQTAPDEIDRKYLVPIGNVDNLWYGSPYAELQHPGHFPSTIYIDGRKPLKKLYTDGWEEPEVFYQKAWDLNNYDNPLDWIGYPAVQTTGFSRIDSHKTARADELFKIYLKEHNLTREVLDDGTVLYAHPEVTITADRIKANGGSLGHITNLGQWKYPGEVTTIPSNNITMKGVDYPVIGVSNTGDTKYMLPNMDYLFEGQYVTEYPLHKYQIGGFIPKPITVAGTTPETSETNVNYTPIQEKTVFNQAVRNQAEANAKSQGRKTPTQKDFNIAYGQLTRPEDKPIEQNFNPVTGERQYTKEEQDLGTLQGAGLLTEGLFWALDPIGMAGYSLMDKSPRLFNSNNTLTENLEQEGISPVVAPFIVGGLGSGLTHGISKGIESAANAKILKELELAQNYDRAINARIKETPSHNRVKLGDVEINDPTLEQAVQEAANIERLLRPKQKVLLLPQSTGIYPQIKPLIRGAEIEKQLSKAGTISRKSLDAYIAKQSKYYQEVMNETLEADFKGVDKIDYTAFKDAVQKRLPEYNRVSQTDFQDYGLGGLGYSPYEFMDGFGNPLESSNLKTFTFESPNITGNNMHYSGNPIGHSRTYTTKEEPNVLHVMESQSDWAQHPSEKPKYTFSMDQNGRTNIIVDARGKYHFVESGKGMPYEEYMDLSKPRDEMHHTKAKKQWEAEQEANASRNKHMQDNYTERQIQENLKYAAEQGQTKMRYPTKETAVKIEGYKGIPQESSESTRIYNEYEQLVKDLSSEYNQKVKKALYSRRELFGKYESDFKHYKSLGDNQEFREKLNELSDKYKKLYDSSTYSVYSPEHETILKKYDAFPKQFQKLFGKKAEVRTVTDSKGNTWYEVDVPESYRNKTGQIIFSLGGLLGTGALIDK